MSNTPRTDEQELAYEAEDGSTYVHTTFARELEREIRQLEVAIYDLKTKNNELQKALDAVIEDRDFYHEENAELCKYKERMEEWLLATYDVVELVKDRDRLEWLLPLDGWVSTREDIDRMRGEDDGDLDRLNQDL